MPSGLVQTEHDEEIWARAKAQAGKQGQGENRAYVNSIYQNMKGTKEPSSKESSLGVAQILRRWQRRRS